MRMKIFSIFIVFLMFTPIVFSAQNADVKPAAAVPASHSAYKLRNEISRLAIKRMLISNSLRLDDSQKERASAIFKETEEQEASLSLDLKEEMKKLESLGKSKAFCKEQCAQRSKIRKLECDIAKIRHKNDISFCRILTCKQRQKYKNLKKNIQY